MDNSTLVMFAGQIVLVIGYWFQSRDKAKITDVDRLDRAVKRVDEAHLLNIQTLTAQIKEQEKDITQLKQDVRDCEHERSILMRFQRVATETLIEHNIKPPIAGLTDLLVELHKEDHSQPKHKPKPQTTSIQP